MKAFVFRLDSILSLRAREEAQAQERFEKATHARFDAELELTKAREELDRCELAISGQRAIASTGNRQVMLLNSAKVQREICERLLVRLEAARKEMESRREIFQTARRKHQAVEKLRERQLRTHLTAEQRREETAISDLIISRHALNRDGAFA